MSLINKLFSGLTVGAAVFAFSAIGMAQTATTTTTAPADKVEKEKGEHRGHGNGEFGKRGMGRGEFGGRMGGHRGMARRGMMMLHGLDLTEAQKTQLRTIHESNKPSQEIRDEMRTLMMAKRDGTITADQQTRLTALKAQGKEKHEAVKAQIEAILTPEQKAKMETRKQEMRQRMEERRQMREERKAAKPATTTTTEKPKDN